MFNLSFPTLLALLVLSTTLFAAPDTKPKQADSEKPKPSTTAKTSADTAEEATELAAAPAKVDLGAEKFWQALLLLESKDAAELTKGRELLQVAADLEYPHAQTLLAECLMTGQYGFSKDQRKAANYYRLAAERGNAFAMVSLGQCFYTGTGVKKTREKAAEWLTAALDAKADYARPVPPPNYLAAVSKQKGNNDTVAGELERDSVGDCQASAHYLLGLIATTDKKTEQAQKHYVQAASAGLDGRSGIYAAAVQAALNYAFGQGTPRDMTKANEMLAVSRKLTVRSGVRMIHNYTALKVVDDFAAGDLEDNLTAEGEKFQTNTQLEIANIFTDKSSKDYNPAEAAKWYELAAENGNVGAMLKLAFLYSGNELGKPDPVKAFKWFERADPKHYLGTANFAICLYNGIGTPMDAAKAIDLFKKNKDNAFLCYLGSINQCPSAIVTWEENMKFLETWAKTKKDPQAQSLMGVSYMDGWNGPSDIPAAIRWFKKASATNNTLAWLRLGYLHEFQRDAFDESLSASIHSAAECYKKAADAGNPYAMSNYATLIITGKVKPSYENQAEELFLQSLKINPTFQIAPTNLGFVYEKRARDPKNVAAQKDKERMFEYYEQGVRLENATAARNLANIYREGVLTERNLHKTYSYFEQAAQWGKSELHFELGKMHENGEGVPVTYIEAAYHYRLAALEGHLPSLRSLIDLYISGKLGEIDWDRAMFWVIRSVSLGETAALKTGVDILLRNHQYASALQLLRFLEEEGSPSEKGFAYERLSRCYEEGIGVKANPTKAKKYFERALAKKNGDAIARQGMLLMKEGKFDEGIAAFQQASSSSGDACYYLGQLYFYGTHIAKDQSKALQLLRKATGYNHPEALCFLAGTTYNNIPGAPTIDEAILLATQAETCGVEKARALREKLEQRRDKKNEDTPEEEAAHARSS